MLRRLLKYCEKLYALREYLRRIVDARLRPRIETFNIVSCALVMALAQMGSLNALEQTGESRFWKQWGIVLPSADTLGRVFGLIDLQGLRAVIKHVYNRLKRNKALRTPFPNNLFAVVIDGHESGASYRRCCSGCLSREIKTASGSMTQYYHRYVMAVLLCKDFVLLLDLERQHRGEDEVATAQRLLLRLFIDYPRAFDIVMADGLYARAPFLNL